MQLTITRRWAETDSDGGDWALCILDYTAYVRRNDTVYRWVAYMRGARIGFGHEASEAAAKAVSELTIGQHWNSGGGA